MNHKRIAVRFKNGRVETYVYKNTEQFHYDMDVIERVMKEPRHTSGCLGSFEDGFFINALDVAAVEILPEITERRYALMKETKGFSETEINFEKEI